MLEKAIIFTTPKMQKRHHYMEASLISRGVDINQIHKWPGADHRDYQQTADVFEDARDDGFPHFQRWLDKKRQNDVNITVACQHWNWCQVLTHIASHKSSVLLLQDDIFLRRDYVEYVRDYTFLNEASIDFKMLLLQHWKVDPLHPTCPPINPEGIIDFKDNLTTLPWIVGGILGANDQAFILSPSGAQFLLDAKLNLYKTDFFYKTDGRLEYIPGMLSLDTNKRLTDGCFSIPYRYIDFYGSHFFSRAALPSQVHKGKGWDWIRSPKETKGP